MVDRTLTEPEVRAIATMLFASTDFTMKTVAGWMERKKPPTKQEMHMFLLAMQDAFRTIPDHATGERPADIARIDRAIDSYKSWTDRLMEQAHEG
jgi:hypothetical protein